MKVILENLQQLPIFYQILIAIIYLLAPAMVLLVIDRKNFSVIKYISILVLKTLRIISFMVILLLLTFELSYLVVGAAQFDSFSDIINITNMKNTLMGTNYFYYSLIVILPLSIFIIESILSKSYLTFKLFKFNNTLALPFFVDYTFYIVSEDRRIDEKEIRKLLEMKVLKENEIKQ